MSKIEEPGFDLGVLVDKLKDASRRSDPVKRIRSIMDCTFDDPAAVKRHVPDFERDETTLFEDEQVSIWHCRFPPGLIIPPHDHQMTAIIGLYSGIERNSFFRFDTIGNLEKSGHTDLVPGDVLQIAPAAIHGVECIGDEPTSGIHVYLGALTKVNRSLFDQKDQKRLKFTEENFNRLTAQLSDRADNP